MMIRLIKTKIRKEQGTFEQTEEAPLKRGVLGSERRKEKSKLGTRNREKF